MLFYRKFTASMMLLLSSQLLLGCPGGDVIGDGERQCLEERRCATDQEQVCGEDGKLYACASMARCEGAIVDPSGQACQLPPDPPVCEDELCPSVCPDGSEFKRDAQGCLTCECEPVVCERMDRFACPPNSRLVCESFDESGCEVCECQEEVLCPTIDPPECDGPNERLVCEEVDGCQQCECEQVVSCPDLEPLLVCDGDLELVCDRLDENGCEVCECVAPTQCPDIAEPDNCPEQVENIDCGPDAFLDCVWQRETRDANWQCVDAACYGPTCLALAPPNCSDSQVARCDDLDGDGCEECWCEAAGCPLPEYPECDGDGEELVQRFGADGCADYSCSVPQCEPVDCDLFCLYGVSFTEDGCEVCACRIEPLSCMRNADCDQGLTCVFDDRDPAVCCKPGEACDDLYPPCVGECIYP